MKHITDRFTVVLDANVLFPFRTRDILLNFFQAGLFRARWSPQILDEWTKNVLAKYPRSKKSIFSQLQAMQKQFPDALVTGHEPQISALDLPDEKDRHVLAAAIKCGAQRIVTENLADFPKARLDPYEMEAISADEFLSQTFEIYPTEALAVLRELRSYYSKPPYTASEFLLDLKAKGLPNLAACAGNHRDIL